ncbi:MAG: TRAP transporter small permease [Hoeflea sp.]|uniref:TRAP transporter small permease n=1 Tax=Hoeflea sp. TaxID=1940281 RepID=UPI001DB0E21F|nr:TRAP transporter small permease [Hoeflea sp.]MBV1723913.1 TRAP transporter small permease [Hoeflea sp.]MBV1763190.1 TRAP transporter small permease [Hoeflea sp.]MBV1784753.1 TRAP transporter small permease [Hoeflea sp.]
MSTPRHDLVHSTPVEWTVRMLTLASSLALGLLLLVTFAGVVMRYFFNAPILGSNEIIELVSVAVVMLAMPGAAQRQMHIRVDVFDGLIGAFGRFAGDIVARGLSIYLLTLLGWRAWGKLTDAAEYGDVTNMLSIPLWPFYGLLVLGAALYAIVLAIQLVDILRSGVASSE